MHLSANRKPNRLPKEFPVGTIYVVEGHGGEHGDLRGFSRYVVLPGGQRINLADDFNTNFAGPASSRASRARRPRNPGRSGTPNRVKSAAARAKKIMIRAGTTGQRRR